MHRPMRHLLLLLIVVALGGGLSFGPVLPADPASAQTAATHDDDHVTTKKTPCKKGYVLKKVTKKKRINGKLRTVKVTKCVKRKNGPAQPNPAPTQPDPVQTQPDPVQTQPDPVQTPDSGPAPQNPASCPTPYTGTATGMDGVFEYGDVRVDRTCGEVTRVEIEYVQTCNFTSTVVFNPSAPDITIVEGSNQILGDKMHVVYRPEPTSETQTTMDIVFTGSSAKGEFHSNGYCSQDGLFTATAG